MIQPLQAIRGMNDLLPEKMPYWQVLEAACAAVASSYGYREVRFPLVELTALFKRTIGQETDIVSKEMYTFDDRNGESLSLRPEGTAGCVRMGIEHSLFYRQIQRFWYLGPMFRHERPQKGRYRQFYQFGVETFGISGAAIDAEIIALSYRLWQQLGLENHIHLQLNSLGTLEVRSAYRKALVEYFSQYKSQLEDESLRRLETNPLRILDSKEPNLQDLIYNAPTLIDYLDAASQQHWNKLQQYLKSLNIPFTINPHLVRGLDYYSSTVFEWVTEALGAQGTVCAGGRYDVLVEQLGGQPTPAIGFAMGLERIVLLLEKLREYHYAPDIYWVLFGEAAVEKGLVLAEQLRSEIPKIKIVLNVSGGGFKSQFKRADKSGARWALIIGEDELANDHVSIKDLRGSVGQTTVSMGQVIPFMQNQSMLNN